MNWEAYSRVLLVLPLALAAIFMAGIACAPASGGAGGPGNGVGQPAPAFAMTLADGARVTSSDLDEADQPAHLFWFATW